MLGIDARPASRATGFDFLDRSSWSDHLAGVRSVFLLRPLAASLLAVPDEQRGQAYHLTGPLACTFDHAAAVLTRLTGRQVPSRVGGGLGYIDADEDPPRRPINRHEQITPRGFISHLGQILHIDMQIPRRVGFERFVRGPRGLRHQRLQVGDPMPPQIELSGAIDSSPMARKPAPSARPAG